MVSKIPSSMMSAQIPGSWLVIPRWSLSLVFSPIQGFQCAPGALDLLPGLVAGYVVELVEVDPVCAEVPEAGLELYLKLSGGPFTGFGGEDNLVPDILEGFPDALLAHSIAPRGVEIVDPELVTSADDRDRLLFCDSLDGDASESHGLNPETGSAEGDLLHFAKPRWGAR
jgi:hypothetical protein